MKKYIIVGIILITLIILVLFWKNEKETFKLPRILPQNASQVLRDEPYMIKLPGRFSTVLKDKTVEDLRELFGDEKMLLFVTKTGIVTHYTTDFVKDVYIENPEDDHCIAVFENPSSPVKKLLVRHKQFTLLGRDVFDYFLGKKPPIWCSGEKYYVRSTNKSPQPILKKLTPECYGINHTVSFYLSTVGIVTNIHYDANPGFIVQIRGRKRVLIWPPTEKENLYITFPINHPYGRRSKYDGKVRKDNVYPDYPKISDAKYIEVILSPDECLFIPAGWFHYVETLDKITISSIVRLYPESKSA